MVLYIYMHKYMCTLHMQSLSESPLYPSAVQIYFRRFATRYDRNRPAQRHKLARVLKFLITRGVILSRQFAARYDPNRPAQRHKLARVLKFPITTGGVILYRQQTTKAL